MTSRPRHPGRRRGRATTLLAGVVLTMSLVAGACTSARSGLGTSDDPCYLALPTATAAVGGHGHLEGIRHLTLSGLRGLAPHLYADLADHVSAGQSVCVAAFTGHFASSKVSKPLGRSSGVLAVAVVTRPRNTLLGTLILSHIPVRFSHTHFG